MAEFKTINRSYPRRESMVKTTGQAVYTGDIPAFGAAPWPVSLPDTAALLDSGAAEEEILSACERELKALAMPIKEACISPVRKKDLFRQITMLLHQMNHR